MSGDLPPSSRLKRFILTAEPLMISRPVTVEPVKATRSTSGWADKAAPASEPSPVTTLMTPSGTPASTSNSAMRNTVSDASSAGFMTTVQPVASAPPRIHHWLTSGPFQGMMPPTTPTGALRIMVVKRPGCEFGMVCPLQFMVWLAKNMMVCNIRSFILRVRDRGAPMSVVSITASSSQRCSTRS
ncbi:MAG: hypothetical protein RLZZ371_977 [Pseudomonadota bacterium]